MWKHVVVVALVVAGVFGGPSRASAQSALLNLPDVSQHARVMQRLGITDITIDYHRPLVRGRRIFGGLQPYGQVWRGGANYNTTIEFTDPVKVDGHPIPKGLYGLHFIPTETSWVVIFSRNATSWGSFTYDPAEDALRIDVKPEAIAPHEALSYEFGDPLPNSDIVTMRWETVAVSFTVEVDTPTIVAESLRQQLRGRVQFEWQAWQEAASYLLQNHLSGEEALEDVSRSIAIEDRFENEMVKASALEALGRQAEALAARDKALAMGSQQQVHSYARTLQGQGQNDQALDIFRVNVKKDPTSWIAHSEVSRLAVAKGDYDTAVKEMKLALSLAPESVKGTVSDFVKALENKVDINK